MKKKVILISILFVILSFIIIISFSKENRDFKVMSNINKDKQIINSNMLTLMYETESGSGIYEETKDTNWPASGYIFNENLSGCENGGELEYNSGNNTVNLLSNSSDRCYVYFDKYDGVWIDNVVATNVTGSSVTLDISATSENGSITTYYYAINDSEEYIESTTNPIVINDLNKLTEYKIKIYAIDSTNAKSNIYELTVSTTDESLPVINSVSSSNITEVGFTLTVNATSDVEIEKYYFTIEGEGENNAGTSTTNTFTFNTLNSNTNYNILVFVKNLNGIFSKEYSITVQTDNSTSILVNYIIELYDNNNEGVNGLYYHDGQGTYFNANLEAADNNYRFSGGYTLSSKASSSGYEHVFAATNDDVNELIVRYNSNGVRRTMQNGNASVNDYFTLAYNESVHYENAMLALQKALTDGYLIENVKNYVCFASNSNPCPENNLYRILGLYQNDGIYQIKLIKNNSIGTYAWNTTSDSSWPTASLNTILNTTFLNDLGSWGSLISNYSWSIND